MRNGLCSLGSKELHNDSDSITLKLYIFVFYNPIKFKLNVMGSTYSKGYDLTPHFSLEFHPVEGEVHLFRLKGYSLFLFSNSNNSPLFTQKAQ